MRSVSDDNIRSSAKRVIPAAAMLALSAVMLSTATYAWFTMNKQVEMDGLNMTATAGEGMEISLASVSDSDAITIPTEGEHPDDDSLKSWKSSVIVGQYYEDIGKLRPASSTDGKTLYDATDASEGGKKASKYKAIDLTAEGSKAEVQTKSTLTDADADNPPEINSDGKVGYYVDIPVYLRTNKAEGDETEGSIYCKLMIKNKSNTAGGTSDPNTDILYKAVRVAFIPITNNSSETKIFGVDDEYYDGGPAASDSSKGSATIVTDEAVTDGDEFITGEGFDSGLKIPYASNGEKYGHLDFYVRVWLEGESTSCYDATSGQSWNIDLAFSMDKFEDNQSNP